MILCPELLNEWCQDIHPMSSRMMVQEPRWTITSVGGIMSIPARDTSPVSFFSIILLLKNCTERTQWVWIFLGLSHLFPRNFIAWSKGGFQAFIVSFWVRSCGFNCRHLIISGHGVETRYASSPYARFTKSHGSTRNACPLLEPRVYTRKD